MFQGAFESVVSKSLDESDSTEHRLYKIGKFLLTSMLCILLTIKSNHIVLGPNPIEDCWNLIKAPESIITFIIFFYIVAIWLFPLYLSILNSIAHFISVHMRKGFANFPKPVPVEYRKPFKLEDLPWTFRKIMERLINIDIIRIKNDRVIGGSTLAKLELYVSKAANQEENLPIDELRDKLLCTTLFIIDLALFQFASPIKKWFFAISLTLLLIGLIQCWMQYVGLKVLSWNVSRISEWVDSIKKSKPWSYHKYIDENMNGYTHSASTSDLSISTQVTTTPKKIEE